MESPCHKRCFEIARRIGRNASFPSISLRKRKSSMTKDAVEGIVRLGQHQHHIDTRIVLSHSKTKMPSLLCLEAQYSRKCLRSSPALSMNAKPVPFPHVLCLRPRYANHSIAMPCSDAVCQPPLMQKGACFSFFPQVVRKKIVFPSREYIH